MMGEQAGVFKDDLRKARCGHKCYECRGEIAKGESYHSFSGLWDGKWDRFKLCVDCAQISGEINQYRDYDEYVVFGELCSEVVEESTQADDPDLFLRFVQVKRKRGAAIPDWMERMRAELSGEKVASTAAQTLTNTDPKV